MDGHSKKNFLICVVRYIFSSIVHSVLLKLRIEVFLSPLIFFNHSGHIKVTKFWAYDVVFAIKSYMKVGHSWFICNSSNLLFVHQNFHINISFTATLPAAWNITKFSNMRTIRIYAQTNQNLACRTTNADTYVTKQIF
jgi:hypothetical protein